MRAGRMHLPALINLSAFCTAVDVVGTTALLLVSIVPMLWLSGKIFRLGVLRTGQPPTRQGIVETVDRYCVTPSLSTASATLCESKPQCTQRLARRFINTCFT